MKYFALKYRCYHAIPNHTQETTTKKMVQILKVRGTFVKCIFVVGIFLPN